jgi:hypothetical protein
MLSTNIDIGIKRPDELGIRPEAKVLTLVDILQKRV